MNQKTVLVLEDRPILRTTVTDGLLKRGFKVVAAGNADEAWRIAETVGDIDVALLDIHLGPGRKDTGLDFGKKLKESRLGWPPEFLMYSAYDNPDYYQHAIALGAAGYLRKGQIGGDPEDPGTSQPARVEVIAQHVRALALRRALHVERPKMKLRLMRIAKESRRREDVYERFCRQILAKELFSVFGESFVLLLTYGNDSVGFFANHEARSNMAFDVVQKTIHGRLGEVDPFVLDMGALTWQRDAPSKEVEGAVPILRLMNGAAFIPLGDTGALRLSLGVLPGELGSTAACDQVRVLERYLQRPAIRHLLEMTKLWSELEAERQRNEVLLKATRDFCFYQGQEMTKLLYDVEKSGTEGAAFKRARIVAEEMRNAGELLTYFPTRDEASALRPEPVDMARLVEEVWAAEIAPRFPVLEQDHLHLDGQCVASEFPIRVERAVGQILGWLVRRLTRLQPEESGGVFVHCISEAGTPRVKVVFEERSSRRVPEELRETFFKPFYESGLNDSPDDVPDKGRRLGLYLAHALADLAGGSLVDASDSIEGDRGHCFELELPAAQVA